MAARRHDAHTTRSPQAFVPATVIPQTRCPRCTYFFLGPHGSLCPSCGGGGTNASPVTNPAAPESPTTDAAASRALVQALQALPGHGDAWRQEMQRRLTEVERRAQTLLEDVSRLRQSVHHSLDAEGGPR
jgi:hypothetical protein